MSHALFLVAVKSTIDKLCNDLALAQDTPTRFVDLDDATAVEDVMTSSDPAVIWDMGSFEESPSDPLYYSTFSIGARTTEDPSNYNILRLTGDIGDVFKVGVSLDIKDYSGSLASESMGRLHILSVSVNPQGFDRISGVRLASVVARAQRWL